MTKMSETIVFFGSGPVAAESLKLIARDFKIEAIVTKPSTKHEMSEVVTGATVYVAQTKSELDDLIVTTRFKSQVAVLIDFGIIVSQKVISSFPLGIVNSHFSLLPLWRGADPISFSILNGDAKTGVSLMLIDEGMDTGKILVQKSLAITPDDTTQTLTKKLINLSHELLVSNLPDYISGKLRPRNQPHPNRATYSRKLTKEDGLIDWTKPAAQIEREIRAFIQWPKSRAEIAGKETIITNALVIEDPGKQPIVMNAEKPGTLTVDGKRLLITCGQGLLEIHRLKPAGKNEMSAESFIAGYGKLLQGKEQPES